MPKTHVRYISTSSSAYHYSLPDIMEWQCYIIFNIFQSLALCTSALMFMLSRDRLNMDLDRDTLNLMLRLLGVDQQEDLATTLSPSATRALKRNWDRVHEVYNEFLQQTGGKQENIDTECISVSINDEYLFRRNCWNGSVYSVCWSVTQGYKLVRRKPQALL